MALVGSLGSEDLSTILSRSRWPIVDEAFDRPSTSPHFYSMRADSHIKTPGYHFVHAFQPNSVTFTNFAKKLGLSRARGLWDRQFRTSSAHLC